MIERFRPAFTGNMAFCADTLVGTDDPRPAIAGEQLLKPETVDAILNTYSVNFRSGDRRAIASYWAQGYFRRLIPPVAAVVLLLDRDLPVAASEAAIIRGEKGEAVAIRLTGDGETNTDLEVNIRLQSFVCDHIEPFITAWTAHTRVAPRLYWSFAAVYMDWALDEIAAHPLAGAPVIDACRFLRCRERLDGTANPLFEPFETVEKHGQSRRQRRVCCIRYRLPGIPFCDSCPHPKARD